MDTFFDVLAMLTTLVIVVGGIALGFILSDKR